MAQMTSNTNQLTGPAWAGDYFSREHLVPGGGKVDASQFNATDAAIVTLTADAAANDTTLAVTALTNPIPSGTLLYFGASKKFALTTAAAAAGATSLTVQALPTALTSGNSATYAGTGTKPKTIIAGTPIGRTYAERDAGTAFGPAGASDDEVFLVAFDVSDASRLNDVELYRHYSLVKENLLPGFSSIVSGVLTLIRKFYDTTKGVA